MRLVNTIGFRYLTKVMEKNLPIAGARRWQDVGEYRPRVVVIVNVCHQHRFCGGTIKSTKNCSLAMYYRRE